MKGLVNKTSGERERGGLAGAKKEDERGNDRQDKE